MDKQNYEYRTGRTSPQKHHSGLITLLLILMIFLTGIVSALGLLNIHLFRQLMPERGGGTPVSFSQGADCPSLPWEGGVSLVFGGMDLQETPVVYQKMHNLPPGLYVCHIETGSAAQQLGILPGDVLTCFDGTPVTSVSGLQNLLRTCQPGNRAELLFSRDGQQLPITLILTEQGA